MTALAVDQNEHCVVGYRHFERSIVPHGLQKMRGLSIPIACWASKMLKETSRQRVFGWRHARLIGQCQMDEMPASQQRSIQQVQE
jgi:hypothetical protein